MDDLFIVMPAYNEGENIEKVVRSWYLLLEGKGKNAKLIVADSGSTDNTHEVLMRLQRELPNLEVLSNTRKQHGPKLIALYQYAIKKGAEYIFQTDSDGQTDVGEFEGFWKYRNEFDAILGKRPSRGDGMIRACIEDILCIILRIYFKVAIPDANAPFRLMKAELVNKYLKRMPMDYNIPNVMLSTYFVFYSENIVFKDITFKARQGGQIPLIYGKL